MKNTQTVKMLSPFEWAKIIGDKYGNKVAISFISQLNPYIADTPAFSPACYFDMCNTKEGMSFWMDVSNYAQDVVWNIDEAIEEQIIAPHFKQIEDIINSKEPMFDSEKVRIEGTPTDELIDKLIATTAWMNAIKILKMTTWMKKKEVIAQLKKEVNQDPDAINRLTELLNKTISIWQLTK